MGRLVRAYDFIYGPPGSWLAGVRINGDSPGGQSRGGLPCGSQYAESSLRSWLQPSARPY